MGRSGFRPSNSARGRTTQFGLWRAIAATPAMLGSLLLVSVAVGALGRWAEPMLLGWAACGAVMSTRVGERITVRAACRFRCPSPAQAEALQRPWATALRMTGTAAGDVELYVQTVQVPNAYAAGGRSVAVTSRVVKDYRAGRLSEDQLVAVLVHELGHHATRATRPMLLTLWLAMPWRLAARLLTGIGLALSGRQTRRGLILVIAAGVAVAVTRAVYQGQVLVGGVLAAVAISAVSVRWLTPRSADAPSSPPTGSPPTAASRWVWLPRCPLLMTPDAWAPNGRHGSWRPTRPPAGGSVRSSRRRPPHPNDLRRAPT
jgi:STE24 endopeptidase